MNLPPDDDSVASRTMQNIAIILTLLLLPYWALIPAHVSEPLRGRIGVALVFVFTRVGHFIKTSAMTQMLPPKAIFEAFPQIWALAASGKLRVDTERVPLADVEAAWQRHDTPGRRLVITP